jgi:hypothetical protein
MSFSSRRLEQAEFVAREVLLQRAREYAELEQHASVVVPKYRLCKAAREWRFAENSLLAQRAEPEPEPVPHPECIRPWVVPEICAERRWTVVCPVHGKEKPR